MFSKFHVFSTPAFKFAVFFISLLLIINVGYTLSLKAAGDSICVNIVSGECAGADDTSGSGAVEWTDGSAGFGSFFPDLGKSGNTKVSITSVGVDGSVSPRLGSAMAKISKSGPYPHRAELSDGNYRHPTIDPISGSRFNYWYGWSVYIPNVANWSYTQDWLQYIAQWRYSNINGCFDTQTPDGSYLGGSGGHMMVKDGRFAISNTPLSDEGPLRGHDDQVHDLGPAVKGQWVDFVMQTKWSPYNDGLQKIWMNTGSGYTEILNRQDTPNWIDTYSTASTCPVAGQVVPAPNWQVGMYFSTDAISESTPRIMYADELREYRTIQNGDVGTEVWNKVVR
jgi:Polysaccharide lyase